MPNIIYVLFRRLRYPLVVLVFVYAISILGFVLIPGQDDSGQPWRMDFFHAFYFVSFMGTTIGFGEIPYAFTDAQRMWAIVAMYASVIAWLYGIGGLLATMQDPAFRKLLSDSSFKRRVNHIRDDFFLICGYGDTGSLLVSALAEEGFRSVVVDRDEDRINALELEDIALHPPGLCGDASRPNILKKAGITHERCIGVVALTGQDQVNLRIALSAHLLKPEGEEGKVVSRPPLMTIARAETTGMEGNILSFGNNQVINPFTTFAGRLALALHTPGMFILYEWLTGVPYEKLSDPVYPPRGQWILCGYGRFGKAMYERLISEGVMTTIVEANPELTQAPDDIVIGSGTEAATLLEAGIHQATGIVAGTDDDANNLSILMTARELNPNLFMVARQNRRRNDELFKGANIDLVMQRGSVIAHKIFALIRTPLIGSFLWKAQQHDNDWANTLVSRIAGVVHDEVPHIWELAISYEESPVLQSRLRDQDILLSDLRRDPHWREGFLPCIPLLLKRGFDDILLPDESMLLEPGDKVLFCGEKRAHRLMEILMHNADVLRYVLTGNPYSSSFFGKWLRGRYRPADDSGKSS